MRAAILVLIVLNLALIAALKLRTGGERHTPAVNGPDAKKITILAGRDVIQVVERCVELGPFGQQEAQAAVGMLNERRLGDLVSTIDASLTDGWWVYVPPRPNRAEALKRAKELEKLGVRDLHVFEDGVHKHAISLGVFRSEAAATDYLADLMARGVRNAKVARQEQRVTTRLIYVRSQAPEVIAQVNEVKAQFTRAELRQVLCPKASTAEARGNSG